ncbi:MAG: serine/threonine protein kinase [Thermoleophilaceae bacterium]|nr:serine/threonine protein kinase [Thermoleophilaceae bacterium]
MSTVYRAFDETLERWVAIKLLHSEISSDSDQIERFRREARAVARLSHPHVVTVIDAGEDQGQPYIVFEHVAGETLKERIRRLGRLPITEALAYAIEIGRALEAAHAQRLVHRDVKPQNVLIDSDGRAKVTDFGIARSLADEGLTAAGRVLGTTDYVSPEQALGEQVTQQSDVYSLGIVLFEMLTGEVPFKADAPVAVAMKHVREPMPDVRRLRPEVSAATAAVVDRATCKEMRNRYSTAADMIADLEQALAIEVARAGHTSGEATTVLRALPPTTAERFLPWRLRAPRRALVLSTLLVGAAALALALLLTQTHPGSTGGARPSKQSAQLELATFRGGSVHDYDPAPGGDGQEHPDDVANVLDGNPSTAWTTEQYENGAFPPEKTGVGLYVDAGRPVLARELDLTADPGGFEAAVYATSARPVPSSVEGWRQLSGSQLVGGSAQFRLSAGGARYRDYLIWITKLPRGGRAGIGEVSLRIAQKR